MSQHGRRATRQAALPSLVRDGKASLAPTNDKPGGVLYQKSKLVHNLAK
jgi:hypothetical protein